MPSGNSDNITKEIKETLINMGIPQDQVEAMNATVRSFFTESEAYVKTYLHEVKTTPQQLNKLDNIQLFVLFDALKMDLDTAAYVDAFAVAQDVLTFEKAFELSFDQLGRWITVGADALRAGITEVFELSQLELEEYLLLASPITAKALKENIISPQQ